MDPSVVAVVWGVAAAVVAVATVVALRAGRRARRAAELVERLLDPAVVVEEGPVFVEPVEPPPPGEYTPLDPPLDPVLNPQLDRPLGLRAGAPPEPRPPARAATSGPAGRDATSRDAASARIPVFDLDRLRWWLTDGDVVLGRIAVVSVELDNLADVRARLGERAGEQLVEAITARLRAVTRPRDVVARVNPERFVLVCRDVPDHDAAQALGERVALGVGHPSVGSAGVAGVTASIGVALAFAAHERPENVLRRAIRAGRRARELGGARLEISTDTPQPSIVDDEFSRALAREELVLHYLPIVSCSTGRVAGFEALVRWDHPARGMLLPPDFLPDAERTGAIVEVGTWALDRACRQMAEWHRGAGESLKLDVNVSAREFGEPSFPAQVKRALGDTGVAPGALWLEITEEVLTRDRELADRVLRQLHEIGVRLVVDDFGTGAASLASLKQFPFDAIKIDRGFVVDLGQHGESTAVCGAIIELAHSLGLCTIAEGVESLEQFATLRGLGCEFGQGHLFGPARPAAEYGRPPFTTLGVAEPETA